LGALADCVKNPDKTQNGTGVLAEVRCLVSMMQVVGPVLSILLVAVVVQWLQECPQLAASFGSTSPSALS